MIEAEKEIQFNSSLDFFRGFSLRSEWKIDTHIFKDPISS